MIGTDWTLLRGSAREKLAMIRPERVQTCITSPPYWGLRDYGCPEEEWADGWTGQLGLEPDPWQYIEHVRECFDAVHRVLRDDGTLWVVIGDTYARRGLSSGPKFNDQFDRGQSPGVRKMAPGLKQGDLVGIPWLLAFALRDRGWYLRAENIWNKPNAMPESVKSRTTRAHEQIFLFAKSHKYYYDHEAVKEPAVSDHPSGNGYKRPARVTYQTDGAPRGSDKQWEMTDKRNRRSVWNVRTRQFPGAHFAVFPHEIVEPCLLAGSAPRGLVLDPFAGTGTVGEVALKHDRRFIGVELNPEYANMAEDHLAAASAMVRSSAVTEANDKEGVC